MIKQSQKICEGGRGNDCEKYERLKITKLSMRDEKWRKILA